MKNIWNLFQKRRERFIWSGCCFCQCTKVSVAPNKSIISRYLFLIAEVKQRRKNLSNAGKTY
jgi:hypothetical protein